MGPPAPSFTKMGTEKKDNRNNQKLIPFLGIGKSGSLEIHVSPYPISPMSVMHMRGRELPLSVKKFLDTGEGSPHEILSDMTNYYEPPKPKR